MDDDYSSDYSDEYQFTEANQKLLEDTVERLHKHPLKWPHYAWHDEQDDWSWSDSPTSDGCGGVEIYDANAEKAPSPELGNMRKRSLSPDGHGVTAPDVKRKCNTSVVIASPHDSPEHNSNYSKPSSDPVNQSRKTSNPSPSTSDRLPSANNDSVPPPSSSDLNVLEPPPPAAASAAGLVEVLQLPADQLHKRLQVELPRLQTEQGLITVAESGLPEPSVYVWLKTVLIPRLLSGPLPSASLSAALCSLARRHPRGVIDHCLLPLSEGEEGPAVQIAQRVAAEGLSEQERGYLTRHLCDRPLGGAAVSMLVSLLPAVTATADLASIIASRLAEVGERSPDSTVVARAMLGLTRVAGAMLESAAVARLVQAAEMGQTPLRRPVLAALNRLGNQS